MSPSVVDVNQVNEEMAYEEAEDNKIYEDHGPGAASSSRRE